MCPRLGNLSVIAVMEGGVLKRDVIWDSPDCMMGGKNGGGLLRARHERLFIHLMQSDVIGAQKKSFIYNIFVICIKLLGPVSFTLRV